MPAQKSGQDPLSEKLSIAKNLGSDFLITGSITKIGINISIDSLLVDVRDKEQTFPVIIQDIGLDNIIPEINTLANKVKKIILGGPALAEYDAAPERPSLTEKYVKTELEKAPPETPGEQPAVTDAPLFEAAEKKESRPVVSKLPPLFQPAPLFTYDFKKEPLHVLAAGDTNGNGEKELLIAGEEKIYVFQVTDKALKLSDEIEAVMDENIVHIDTADINENGLDEIYVSSYEGRHANSFAVEYTEGTYKRIAEEQKWFFRAYEQPGEPVKLLGQQTDTAKLFTGSIYWFEWKKAELQTREEFILPSSLGIYSFAESDIDEDGSSEYIAFSKGLFSSRHQLAVLSYTGRVKWRDTQKLGGAPHSFTKYLQGDADLEQKEILPLRVLCDDLNQDGRLDVIVARNSKKGKTFLKKLADYNQGEVLGLNWDGSDLGASWSSGLLKDHVADYIVEDFDKDGKKELYILSVKAEGFFGKSRNRITVFKLKE